MLIRVIDSKSSLILEFVTLRLLSKINPEMSEENIKKYVRR